MPVSHLATTKNLIMLLKVYVSFCFIPTIFFVRATFIFPQNQINNLISRGTWQEFPICRNASCRPDFNSTSCLQKNVCYKIQTCNGRTELPPAEYPLSHNDTWQPLVGNYCNISYQNQSTLPTLGPSGNLRLLTVSGSAQNSPPCYYQKNTTDDTYFTLVFWVKANCLNCSILELSQSTPANVRIINKTLCLNSLCHNVSTDTWTMISLRVVDNKMNLFTNSKFLLNFTDPNSRHPSALYIGGHEAGKPSNDFQLLNIQYYSGALTDMEISQLMTGLPDIPLDYPQCRCPASYLDLSPNDTSLCQDGSGATFPRYNTSIAYHLPKVIADLTADSEWATPGYANTTLTLTFPSTFQIDGISITFLGEVPKTVLLSFIVNTHERLPQELKCENKVCSLVLWNLNSTTTVEEYRSRIADAVVVKFVSGLASSNQSFIISNYTLLGRCDCHGNSDQCTEVNGSFICACKDSTNTQGNNCQSCKPSYLYSPDQFQCSGQCQCNPAGVVNASDPCDHVSGTCICKSNVVGVKCDTCKPFSFNFSSSNSLGCTQCPCNFQGAIYCSNITGECICKNNTEPKSCDRCKDNYFGISDSQGCQPCNCVTLGTVNQNTTCNQTNGQCQCKQNVQGLQCNACKFGYYNLDAANICTNCNCLAVGSEYLDCNKVTGQCPCRGGVITDKICSPKIDSIDPTYGPELGGTLVTVQGMLLGNDNNKVFVYFDDVKQPVISVEDSRLVFQTLPYNATKPSSPLLKVSWEQDSVPIITQVNFTYKPDPRIFPNTTSAVRSFVSGGCALYIYGENLPSVKYPRLEMTLKNDSSKVAVGFCKHNPTNVICAIPNGQEMYRSSQDVYNLTVVFDGLVNKSLFSIYLLPDPVFHNVGNIRFQYPFEDTITLYGERLTDTGNTEEYSVYVGVVSCAIQSVTDSAIVCRPAVSPQGGERVQSIEVQIGNFKQTVGTLEYLRLHETTNFIIIISCVSAGIFLIILGVLIFLLCRRYRQNRKATSTFTNLDNKISSPEPTTPSVYSELTTKMDTPPKQNGNTELIQVETVFKEPKLGFVNIQAEDDYILEEFLPKIEAGLRDEIQKCYIREGCFTVGRSCYLSGQQAMLTNGSLQNSSSIAGQKLTIKSLIKPMTESNYQTWANLALTECLRLNRQKHINVLSILGVGVDKERFHILYPHMPQNFLKTCISDTNRRYSIRQLLTFGQQVAEGLCYLASKEITHKDVATRNCMLDDHDIVKLSDASFSWDFFPGEYVYDEQRERYLPLRWMAPESLSDGYYDRKTDVWSLAILIWELMTRGCLPFHEVSNDRVKNYILGGYILGQPEALSDQMYTILFNCWSQENDLRPAIGSITRSLGEMLENEDDIYENIVSYSSTASPKHIPAGTETIYSVTNVSNV